jgi:hypothetical protein
MDCAEEKKFDVFFFILHDAAAADLCSVTIKC